MRILPAGQFETAKCIEFVIPECLEAIKMYIYYHRQQYDPQGKPDKIHHSSEDL